MVYHSPRSYTPSPPRGPRHASHSEYRDNRPREPERREGWANERYMNQEYTRPRSRSRSRSRSPAYSPRLFRERLNGNRQEPQEKAMGRHQWNNYRPDYISNKTSKPEKRISTGPQNSRTASPTNTTLQPPLLATSSKGDPIQESRKSDLARKMSKDINSGPYIDNSRVEMINREANAKKTTFSKSPGANPVSGEAQISSTSPSNPPQEVLPSTFMSDNCAIQSPAASLEELIDPAESLGLITRNLVEIGATYAALKDELRKAEKLFQKRKLEYEKSQLHHERYPDIKEHQGASRGEAEKAVLAAKASLKKQDAVFGTLASKIAKESLPRIISKASGGGVDREQFERMEKTCSGFELLLKKQNEMILALQKDKEEAINLYQKESQEQAKRVEDQVEAKVNAANQRLQDHFKADQQSLQNQFKADLEMLKTQTSEMMLQKQQTISRLEKDLVDTKQGAIELASKLNLLALKIDGHREHIDTLANRTGDLGNIRDDLKLLRDFSKEITPQFNLLWTEQKQISSRVADYEATQQTVRELGENLKSIQRRPDNLEARLQDLDILTPRTTPATPKKELKLLSERVTCVETPSRNLTPKLTNTQLAMAAAADASTVSRLEALEQKESTRAEDVAHLKEKIEEVVATTHGTVSKEDAQKATDNISDLQARVNALERGPSSEDSSTATNLAAVEGSVAHLKNEVEILRITQDSFPDAIGDVVKYGIKDITSDFNKRLESFRIELGVAKSDVDGLKAAHGSLHHENKSTAALVSSLEDKVAVMNQQFDATNGIEARLKLAWQGSNQHFAGLLNQELGGFRAELQGLTHSCTSLMSRVDNINTKDMSIMMLGQLTEMYPTLHETQAAIAGFQSSLETVQKQLNNQHLNHPNALQEHSLQDLRDEIKVFYQKIADLGNTITKISVATSTATESGLVELQGKLEQLQADIAKEQSNSIAGVLEAVDDKLASIKTHYTSGLGETVKTHTAQIERLNNQFRLAQSELKPSATPPVEGFQLRGQAQKVRTVQITSNTAPRQSGSAARPNNSRQPSAQSIRPSHPPSNANRPSENGQRGSSHKRKGLATASPVSNHVEQRKKPRIKPIPDTEDEDPDFDPENEIPAPGLDSEEDDDDE